MIISIYENEDEIELRRMDGQTNGRIAGWTVRRMELQTDGRTDRRTERRMERLMGGRINGPRS